MNQEQYYMLPKQAVDNIYTIMKDAVDIMGFMLDGAKDDICYYNRVDDEWQQDAMLSKQLEDLF